MRTCPWLLAVVVVAHPTIVQAQAHTVRQVDDCVNVRDDHDTDANIVGCLATGTAVEVIDSVPFWREITFAPNGRGWMAKKFLEPTAGGAPDPGDGTIPADAFLEVHFIDVAQGDAIWITTHDDGVAGNGRFDGRNIVLDGGPYSANSKPNAINPLQQYMETHGHHNAVLDALIVTHPHIDHYRGGENLSRHMTVRDYYDPGHPSTSSYDAFIDALRRHGTPRRAGPPWPSQFRLPGLGQRDRDERPVHRWRHHDHSARRREHAGQQLVDRPPAGLW